VVDEAVGQHDPALDVDQREAAGAQRVVVAVPAERELRLAAEPRDGQREVGVVGRLHAVLDPVARGMETGADHAVVALDGLEVAVGDGEHLGAADALGLGNDGKHCRLVLEPLADEGKALVLVARDDDFGPGDRAVRQLEPDGARADRVGFLDASEQRDLAVARIGEAQVVGPARGERVPQPVARIERDVVLGVEQVRRPFGARRIARIERRQEAVERFVELFPCRQDTLPRLTWAPAS